VRHALDREAPARRSEVRWVRLEGVHLTLHFLGPTEPARVEDVAAAVAEAATAQVPFEVVVSGAGAFPSPLRPRTLWLGVEVGQHELARLARSVDDELARRGWPPADREFRAHLTLARADGRREGPRAARLLAERARDLEVGFPIDRVVLFESVTGGGPARYVPLHEAHLVQREGR
jgi:2'-5' RNA ligase